MMWKHCFVLWLCSPTKLQQQLGLLCLWKFTSPPPQKKIKPSVPKHDIVGFRGVVLVFPSCSFLSIEGLWEGAMWEHFVQDFSSQTLSAHQHVLKLIIYMKMDLSSVTQLSIYISNLVHVSGFPCLLPDSVMLAVCVDTDKGGNDF